MQSPTDSDAASEYHRSERLNADRLDWQIKEGLVKNDRPIESPTSQIKQRVSSGGVYNHSDIDPFQMSEEAPEDRPISEVHGRGLTDCPKCKRTFQNGRDYRWHLKDVHERPKTRSVLQ